MAFATTSYVNGNSLRSALAGTAFNLTTDTINAALYTDSITGQDKNASETYNVGAYASNQVSSAGYTAGGSAIASPTITTPTTGKWIFKPTSATTLAWSGVTFTARGVVIYDVTASNRVLAAINFGADQPVVSGSFTITWDTTNGIFYATY